MRHKTAELVTRYEASGLTAQDFCKRRSISLATLRYHLRKRKQEKVDVVEVPPFMPLVPVIKTARPRVTIVTLDGDFTPQVLSELVRALER